MLKEIIGFASGLVVIGIFGSILTFQWEKPISPVEERVSVDSDNIAVVQLETTRAQIQVRPTEKDEIIIELIGNTSPKLKHQLQTEVVNETLMVNVTETRVGPVYMDFFMREVTLMVELPVKQYEALMVQSAVGNIAVTDIAANQIDVEANVGAISLSNLHAEEITVRNDVGATSLTNLTGDIEVKNRVGQVTVEAEALVQNMDIHTEIGAIKVRFDQKPDNATFLLSSEIGSVSLFGESIPHNMINDGEYTVTLTSQVGEVRVR